MASLYKRRKTLFRYKPGLIEGTFTRASSAYQSDSAQTLESLATDALRDAHYVLNPVTSLYERTTLTEQQRTNLLTYSEQFDNAAWTKTASSSVTPNDAVAPDGVASADLLSIPSNDAGVYHATTCDGTSTYAAAVWVKGTAGNKVHFGVNENATTYITHTFSGDWERIDVTGVFGLNANYHFRTDVPYVGMSQLAAVSFHAWGAQLEQASVASSYIKTEGTTASRAADNLSFTFPHKPQAMTIYARLFNMGGSELSGQNGILHLGANGDAEKLKLFWNSGAIQIAHRNDQAAETGSNVTPTTSVGDVVEIRGTMDENGAPQVHVSINGGSEASGAKGGNAAFASAYPTQSVKLNATEGTLHSLNAFTHAAIFRGDRPLTYCRARR